MQLNSARSGLRPRAPARASLAMHRLLLNVARLHCLTCRGLHALSARLSLHALSSQARLFWTLTISSMSCAFLRFLETSATRRLKHNWTSMVIEWTILHNFLHLCIFGACRCITTALFSVAVVSARVVERSDSITWSHPMILVLCLLLRSCHARLPTQYARYRFHLQSASVIATCDAASSLRAVCNSAILPFELRAVTAVFMSLKH